ncbi:hypothetical protein SAMD00019534_026660 [Acytostelium subglobosum LB1]|uniref:hypothetical protein n=1 Tax=Acytostelium subglobosum LB1 TaxID=1410327 RepID=UPI0006449E67|nr:hypothetical protein SAMD00019534_026660 [Acytostelium subglobosum LB1]GAM19491.1 hypothetical protein SAMD00019534_026660 [Acytostelium subglobosum LB1]|eukprot:XP_012757418.1 hypothetical protein SAMD00019534_026660 [Acytostelium subglobosum LB1]
MNRLVGLTIRHSTQSAVLRRQSTLSINSNITSALFLRHFTTDGSSSSSSSNNNNNNNKSSNVNQQQQQQKQQQKGHPKDLLQSRQQRPQSMQARQQRHGSNPFVKSQHIQSQPTGLYTNSGTYNASSQGGGAQHNEDDDDDRELSEQERQEQDRQIDLQLQHDLAQLEHELVIDDNELPRDSDEFSRDEFRRLANQLRLSEKIQVENERIALVKQREKALLGTQQDTPQTRRSLLNLESMVPESLLKEMEAEDPESKDAPLALDDEEGNEDDVPNEDVEFFESEPILYQTTEQGSLEMRRRRQERPLQLNAIKPMTKQLPYSHATSDIESALRMHFRKFLHNVNPKRFSNEAKASTNRQSLWKLARLLNNRDDYVALVNGTSLSTKLERVPLTTAFTFHYETEQGAEGLLTHQFVFEESPAEIATSKSALISYTARFRLALDRQLYELVKKSGIAVTAKELKDLQNPEATMGAQLYEDPWESYFDSQGRDQRELAMMEHKSSITSMVEELVRPASKTQEKTLDDILFEGIEQEHDIDDIIDEDGTVVDNQHDVEEAATKAAEENSQNELQSMFNEDKLYFYFGKNAKGDISEMHARGLGELTNKQIEHLRSNLKVLEYNEWYQLPILITKPQFLEKMQEATSQQGFVVLATDFDPYTTLPYIKQQVPRLSKTFRDLYTTAKTNLSILDKTLSIVEKTLGANSLIIEDMFYVNQPSMRAAREKLSKTNTTVSKMTVPILRVFETERANKWLSLPDSRVDDIDFMKWQLHNIKLDGIAKTQLAESIIKQEYHYLTAEELAMAVEGLLQTVSNKNVVSDVRETPLTIIDNNQVEYIQTAPKVNAAMKAANRLLEMLTTEQQVPLVFPKNKVEMNTTENKVNQEEEQMENMSDIGVFDSPKQTVEYLTHRESLAPVQADLNAQSRAKLVSNFAAPTFGTGAETNVNDATNVDAASESTQDALDAAEKPDTETVNARQKLTDFPWSNIHVVISDHYNFIMSHDLEVAFVFIPMNFTERDLVLFLNSHYDKMMLLHNRYYQSVMQPTQNLLQLKAIETVINSIVEKSALASVRIDADSIVSTQAQYDAASHLKNVIFLSTDVASIQTVGPHVDIVIGAPSFLIEYQGDDKSRATIHLPQQDRSAFNFTHIITELTNNSPFFKQLLPDYKPSSFGLSSIFQSN